METAWLWLFRLFAPIAGEPPASDGPLRVLLAFIFLALVVGFCWALLKLWDDERP